MPNEVKLLSPEALTLLEALERDATRAEWIHEIADDGFGPPNKTGALWLGFNGTVGPEQMIATFSDTDDADVTCELRNAAPSLLLAHRLLTQMAQALEAAEEDIAEIPGRLDAPSLVIVRKALDRFYAAQGTAEEAADGQ